MVSLDYICSLMERLGYIDFHRYDSRPLQRRLKRAFYIVQTTILFSFTSSYLVSILTRNYRYVPELILTVNELIMLCMMTFFCSYLSSQHRTLTHLVNFMQTGFSRANKEIVRVCHARGRLVFFTFLALGGLVYFGFLCEVLLPVSETEQDILRRVYRTKHPERRLLVRIRVPGVDETEVWTYGVLLAIEIYMGFMLVTLFTVSVTFVPVILIHFRGQCEMLSSFLALVGRQHRDRDGNQIRYTSIERNEFVRETCRECRGFGRRDSLTHQRQFKKPLDAFVCTDPGRSSRDESLARGFGKKIRDNEIAGDKYVEKDGRRVVVRHLPSRRKMAAKLQDERYELEYLRQVVMFHQKLIRFHEELCRLINPIIFQVIVFNSVIFSISIYQLSLLLSHQSTISTSRQVKLVAEFLAITLEYYLVLNCSEMSDMCHEVVRRGVVESGWDAAGPRTRRQLCILLRRVQVSNHIKLQGAGNTFVLSRRFFVMVMRLAYSFVNYMNLMNVKR